jgi:alkylation response protein AidB-like acyl-CoA dehydrogenase
VFVLNGQKVWTSGAHYCDFGIVLARTDPDVPKHKGLTMFVLDMRTTGVEVRPLRQINGAAQFNEVFLTDVRIPADHLLGETGDGWRVALTTLMNERASIGTGRSAEKVNPLSHIAVHVDLAQERDLMAAWDPAADEAPLASQLVLAAPASGIAGGTNEVMRTILGELVLGLPKEPQIDRDVPFRDLPCS